MRNLLHLRWLIAILVLITGVSVWARAENDSSATTDQIANFYASRGHSDEYGVYIGDTVFVVQVPAGDYVLKYKTNLGTFHLVFRATEKSFLYVGLEPGDAIVDVIIFPGTIFDTSKESQAHGTVTLYAWPGSSTTWQDIFRQP